MAGRQKVRTKASKRARLLLASAAGLGLVALASPSWAARCEDLTRLQLPDTVIKSAVTVPAGDAAAIGKGAPADLPAFCRVVAEVKAAPDSDVLVEVWLPLEHWAGVFHGTGNGGFAGLLASGYPAMQAGLRRHYATATTDMGTAPATPLIGDPLVGHPRKWKDWGKLSTHTMTVTGKAIAKAFYSAPAKRAYFTGCSTGGQQGLIEAQYYPEDYDGILVGAPVVNRTWGHAAAVWDWLAANGSPGAKLSDAKLAFLNKAAIADCAGKGNGLASDPFIADPTACRFDPGVLTCKGAASDACLTDAEVRTVRAYYSGPQDRAGHATYFGWLPGSEAPVGLSWSFIESPPGGQPAFGGLFKWVFGKDWDWRKFDFDRDMPKVDAMLGPDLNGVTRGDMSRFRARGGKLIIFQGWADPLVSPAQTLDFYKRLSRKAGGTAKAQRFARLFFAPGMMHCGGGPGPGDFNSAAGGHPPSPTAGDDLFFALSRWVEDGEAPRRVIATRYADGLPAKGVAMRRPLCAWPQKAWYKGSGDTNDDASFVCAAKRPAKS
ncbi:MAG: tannase/feruloyl esterase family alpha/beta hydrolase [Proteobacteria bacterium]|nr:tannase/feruloyl esterase family alpha/beta hydrolase [Pseudomonadota bacterium]